VIGAVAKGTGAQRAVGLAIAIAIHVAMIIHTGVRAKKLATRI
jgi:hypothetical protein